MEEEAFRVTLYNELHRSTAAAFQLKQEKYALIEERQHLQDHVGALENKVKFLKGAAAVDLSDHSSINHDEEVIGDILSKAQILRLQYGSFEKDLAARDAEVASLQLRNRERSEEQHALREKNEALSASAAHDLKTFEFKLAEQIETSMRELRTLQLDVQRLQLEKHSLQEQLQLRASNETDVPDHELRSTIVGSDLEIQNLQQLLKEQKGQSDATIACQQGLIQELTKQLAFANAMLKDVNRPNSQSRLETTNGSSSASSAPQMKVSELAMSRRKVNEAVLELSNSNDGKVLSEDTCVIPEERQRSLNQFPNFVPDITNDEDEICHFSRPFLTSMLGGSPQPLISIIAGSSTALSESRNITAYLCPNAVLNPWCPTMPGQSGYMFVGLTEKDANFFAEATTRNLFVLVGQARCRYLGIYRAVTVEPLTAAEWLTLPERVRHEYSKTTQKKRNDGLSVKETTEAYNSGRLRVPCVELKCINFDSTLYDRLVEANQSSTSRTPSRAPGKRKRSSASTAETSRKKNAP